MDALTWFKSRFLRTRQDPALSRADVATETWADVPPLRPVLIIRQPPPAPADGDGDWDAVIARARIQAVGPARSRRPSPLPPEASLEMQATPLPVLLPEAAVRGPGLPRPPSLRRAWPKAPAASPPRAPQCVPPEMQVTPPPVLVAQAPISPAERPKLQWAGDPEQLKARLDALLSARPKSPTAPYPPLAVRR